MPEPTNRKELSHAEKFDSALTEILSVSKAEILRREAEAKKRRESARDARKAAR